MASPGGTPAAGAAAAPPPASAAVPAANCFSPSAPTSAELTLRGMPIHDTLETRHEADAAAWRVNVESYHNQGFPKSPYWKAKAEQRQKRAAAAAGQPRGTQAKKRPKPGKHPLCERWIEHGGYKPTPHVQITVLLRNADLLRPHGAGDGFEAFEVLCWQDHGGLAVLGATIGGETQLRLVPSSSLRRATLEALRKIDAKGSGDYKAKGQRESYAAASFATGASFVGASGAGRRPVLLIRDGPFEHLACNEPMRAFLLEKLSWTRERSGGKSQSDSVNYHHVFTIASDDIKALPQLPDAASGVDVVQYDFRGQATRASFEDVVAVMRDKASRLPHWPTAAAHKGKPCVLTALQTWLDPSRPPDGAASRGRTLTFRALGVPLAATRQTRSAAQEVEPPAFALCNGQADAGGRPKPGKTWAKHLSCRCGLELGGESAGLLSQRQMRERCK